MYAFYCSMSRARPIFRHLSVNVDSILSLSEKFLRVADRATGAGILFICPDDSTTLFIQRSAEVEDSGTWGIPGGSIEAGEEPPDAAQRETIEELGSMPQRMKYIETMINKGSRGEYHIFVMSISADEKSIWTPNIKLNHESVQFKWFRFSNMPENLHPAIKIIQT